MDRPSRYLKKIEQCCKELARAQKWDCESAEIVLWSDEPLLEGFLFCFAYERPTKARNRCASSYGTDAYIEVKLNPERTLATFKGSSLTEQVEYGVMPIQDVRREHVEGILQPLFDRILPTLGDEYPEVIRLRNRPRPDFIIMAENSLVA